jgi:sugar/nucleoside kinase (ribokinase family)
MGDPSHAAPDVIGFGAINIDYIAGATEEVKEWADRFDRNVETRVDKTTIDEVVDLLGASALDISPGGSAFNATFALARLDLDLRLGYVGVAGREETPGLSFVRLMDAHAVDRRFVREDRRAPCGMCLSYIDDDGGRVMLTCPGANLGMARFIQERFDDLAAYLASARYVHVTSFLDPETPVEMVRVLQAARQANPYLRVSLDPGYDWAVHPSRAVRDLLGLADYLFLTRREFKELGRYTHGEPDTTLAARVLSGARPGAVLLLPHRYDTVDAFQSRAGVVTQRRFAATAFVSDEDIEDTTGTGDVFAAGLLAALASRRLKVEQGAYLGLGLARQRAGPQARGGVFVAHGADPQWQQVKTFLEGECGLPVFGLDEQAQGSDLAHEIRVHLAECGFGVCVFTAETTGPGDLGYAGQTVVHQAGLLQGRYGFRRVAILVEHGCQAFSNVAGLIRLDFPPGRIESTFWQLERMLRREGLISDTRPARR